MHCEDMTLTPHERYEHFYLVIEAAVSQLGVALVPRYLVEKEIASGQLVAPFGLIDSPYTLNLDRTARAPARRRAQARELDPQSDGACCCRNADARSVRPSLLAAAAKSVSGRLQKWAARRPSGR